MALYFNHAHKNILNIFQIVLRYLVVENDLEKTKK